LKSVTEMNIQYDDDFVVVYENENGEKKYYKPEKKYWYMFRISKIELEGIQTYYDKQVIDLTK